MCNCVNWFEVSCLTGSPRPTASRPRATDTLLPHNPPLPPYRAVRGVHRGVRRGGLTATAAADRGRVVLREPGRGGMVSGEQAGSSSEEICPFPFRRGDISGGAAGLPRGSRSRRRYIGRFSRVLLV
jgi:hypothetical protein